MNQQLPRSVLDEFAPDDVMDTSVYVDDCVCGCRSHFTVEDGLLNLHGRPIFEKLLVRGDLSLSGNQEIRRLPKLLAATGSIFVSDCRSLEIMPDRMFAGGSIRLDDTNIRELPGELVAQKLQMERCNNVHTLGKGLCVGIVQAARCASLTTLSEGLEFSSLDLSEAPIGALPCDLKVGFELCLRDCRELNLIPEGVTVGSAIDVRGCDKLFTLPRSVQPNIAVTDGMMLLNKWVIVPSMSAEEASMCLGTKGIHAFPHRHFKNLTHLQEPVTAVHRQVRGIGRDMAAGSLRKEGAPASIPDQMRIIYRRFNQTRVLPTSMYLPGEPND